MKPTSSADISIITSSVVMSAMPRSRGAAVMVLHVIVIGTD